MNQPVLDKRDRRLLRRIAAGKSLPGTIPEERKKKLSDMGLLPADFEVEQLPLEKNPKHQLLPAVVNKLIGDNT